MWPLAWSANLDSRSMAYGSDDVVMTSQSRVFYRLDKNWKRSDTTLAQGVRRTVGQGPCAPEQTTLTHCSLGQVGRSLCAL